MENNDQLISFMKLFSLHILVMYFERYLVTLLLFSCSKLLLPNFLILLHFYNNPPRSRLFIVLQLFQFRENKNNKKTQGLEKQILIIFIQTVEMPSVFTCYRVFVIIKALNALHSYFT